MNSKRAPKKMDEREQSIREREGERERERERCANDQFVCSPMVIVQERRNKDLRRIYACKRKGRKGGKRRTISIKRSM